MIKDFVKIDHDLKENVSFMRTRKSMKRFILITRAIIFSLIIVLFAGPYLETQTTERGSPEVTILIDNSSSMKIFDLNFADELAREINRQMPVTVRTIASDSLTSNLGDEIISYIERNSNILLISDMQSTGGIPIRDAFQYSSLLNSTISAINLKTDVEDNSVWIEGESKTTLKQETAFTVHVNRLNRREYNLMVSVNDMPIYNARDNRESITIRHSFDVGQHVIKAQLMGEDDISENDVFYKTITVVPQPRILYVTRTSSRLPDILGQYYQITKTNNIPSDLSPYYAVVIEDMNTNQISNVDALSDYVSDGNGLLVIGGMNSFDRGGYAGSAFETMLPVRIGRGDRRQGDSNIVILIDMSGSTQEYTLFKDGRRVDVKDTTPLDRIKGLSIDVVETLNRGNRVGVIGFAIPDPDGKESAMFGAVRIAEMDVLANIREQAIDRISRISVQGQTLFDVGFTGAYSMIRHESGSRNVILISDGGSHVHKPVKENAIRIVSRMASEGIRTYTVGIVDEGRGLDEDFLRQVARAGNGNYFPARNVDSLKILFGEPEEKGQGDEMSLFIINPTHFITRQIDELDAKVYGFNQVVPKDLARMLVTTDSGEPVITEWRYGLGRVVALTAFSGQTGLGQILQGENSRLVTRSMNYIIGDPQRKQDNIVTIFDTEINEHVNINIISNEYPRTELDLTKIRDNEYIARTRPESLGINEILNTKFAVNYPREYRKLGMNPEAEAILAIADGKLFEQDETNEIIEHIRTNARRTRITKIYIIWPIILIIVLIYLIEIGCRKIIENKRKI